MKHEGRLRSGIKINEFILYSSQLALPLQSPSDRFIKDFFITNLIIFIMQAIENYNFAGKKAFIRVDFNVPLDENFNITDDTRIRDRKSVV